MRRLWSYLPPAPAAGRQWLHSRRTRTPPRLPDCCRPERRAEGKKQANKPPAAGAACGRAKTHSEASGSAGRLAAHGLFDQTYDHHQDAAADAAGNDLTDNRADIEAACRRFGTRSAAQQRADDLSSHTTTDHAGNRVADRPEVILLECRAGDVAADSTRDQLDD